MAVSSAACLGVGASVPAGAHARTHVNAHALLSPGWFRMQILSNRLSRGVEVVPAAQTEKRSPVPQPVVCPTQATTGESEKELWGAGMGGRGCVCELWWVWCCYKRALGWCTTKQAGGLTLITRYTRLLAPWGIVTVPAAAPSVTEPRVLSVAQAIAVLIEVTAMASEAAAPAVVVKDAAEAPVRTPGLCVEGGAGGSGRAAWCGECVAAGGAPRAAERAPATSTRPPLTRPGSRCSSRWRP